MHRVLSALFVIVLMLGSLSPAVSMAAPTATYTENFDTDGSWINITGTSLTAYGTKEYKNPAHPEVVFHGELALRQGTTAQDGFPGTHSGSYAWRLQDATGSFWQATITTGGVGLWSVWVRRWDNTPDPNYVAEYSTDNGGTWTTVQTINNAWLGSSDWKQISGTINVSNTTGSADDIIIRVRRTAGERLMIDDFEMTDYGLDAAPLVTATTPTNGATNIATNTTITVNFSETVNVVANGITLECPGGTPISLSGLPASNVTSVTLTPGANLPTGTMCTGTVIATAVHDVDTNDPPDTLTTNYTWSFTTAAADLPPSVTSTTPTNGATNVAINASITLNFSEAVDVAAGGVTLECPSGTPIALSGLPAANVTNVTLTHATSLPYNTVCTATAVATAITDKDGTADPMTGNYVWTFTTVADPCGGSATLIHEIQGSGASSPVAGQSKTIMGYVVGDFQVAAQLNGFFVQEEPADWDANAATSEGIFVYQGATTVTDLNVGDKVRLTGTISEYADRTQGGGTITELTSPTNLIVCSTGNTVTPVDITLPETVDGDLEHYEGMLVRITSTTTVAQTYYLGRYGQMSLSGSGRLWTPTNAYRPNTPEALNLANLNARSLLILDDGKAGVRCGDNPNPVPYLGAPPPNVIRGGDTVSNLIGVIDYGQIDSGATGTCSSGATLFGGDYRLHPTQSPVFTATNPRPAAPTASTKLKVVGANLLNFFNGPTFPTSRGAANFTDFVKQRIKLYEELSQLNADVVTLMEVENDGFGSTSAIQDLVNSMNLGPCWNSSTECASLGYSSSGMGAGAYVFVDMGAPIGSDQITVGMMYKPANVDLVGTPAILTDTGYTDPNNTGTQKSRPALAATFREKTTQAVYTVVANHLKSKGSCPTSGVDADQGDGQGCWNDTRKKAAQYLVNTWLPTHPTGVNDEDFLLMGDMNAYAQEDPIQAFKDAGYTDLISQFVPVGNGPQGTGGGYSYVFDGAVGYLDHALASPSLAPQAKTAAEWHNNADEPTVIDYDSSFNPAGYYATNAYRASDHDPVLVGITSSPLAVDLAAFTATPAGAAIALAWETASEQDNAGFNVLRGESQDGPWTTLNPTLIAAAAPGATAGHRYGWTDATLTPGVTYWYRLESVDLADGRQLSNAVSATLSRPTAVNVSGLNATPSPVAFWPIVLLAPALALVLRRRRA